MIYNLHEMITAPILMTSLYIMANPSATTQNVHFLLICSLGFHGSIASLSVSIDDRFNDNNQHNRGVVCIITAVITAVLYTTIVIITNGVLTNTILAWFFGFETFLMVWKLIFGCCVLVLGSENYWGNICRIMFYISRYVYALAIIICLSMMQTQYIGEKQNWSNHPIIWANVIGVSV